MKNVIIFADASSYHNGKPDAFGTCSTLIIDENWNEIERHTKAFDKSTNNFNEIMGVLIGLDRVLNNYSNIQKIQVISDSEYVIKGAKERLFKWIKNDWKNSSGQIVSNIELWKKMYEYIVYCNRNRIIIDFKWQRGHQDKKVTLEENPIIYYQELCDSLAVKYKEKILELKALEV